MKDKKAQQILSGILLIISIIILVLVFFGNDDSDKGESLQIQESTQAATEAESENETEAETVTEIPEEQEEQTEYQETEPETDDEYTEYDNYFEEITESLPEEEAEYFYDYDNENYVEYHFRNRKLLNQHFEKHGGEFADDFGYQTAEEYEKGASDVINNSEALFKYEAEDGDGVYYLESTNEFVILSTDGYIRTYFRPSAGIDYFNRQ